MVMETKLQTTDLYTPERLKRWTRPSCYAGAEWLDHYSSGIGQSRDSTAWERANFDAMIAALKTITESADWAHDFAPWQVVRESHWAVGWVEWIAIHETALEHLKLADSIMERFEDYPVIDEELYSQYENDEANDVWRDCYDVQERVEYIRKHRSQFDFRDFADMLACVRGEYFSGDASEIIS